MGKEYVVVAQCHVRQMCNYLKNMVGNTKNFYGKSFLICF